MSEHHLFFICPVCFRACQDAQECHEHRMMCCDPGAPGDERRKPVVDAAGRVQTRAPRWYLEALGWISFDDSPDAALPKA
jgi:hypothetical protein